MQTKIPTTTIKIAEEFGTPLYIYDADILSESYRSLRLALPSDIDIFYSIKANPNVAICGEFKSLGAGAEVCSLFELEAAIRAGFSPENIIFVGPAKSEDEICRCLKLGVYAIICESKNELELISRIAVQKKVEARVALRINPDHVSKTALLKMGGKPSQFGIDEDDIYSSKEYFTSASNIKIIGIHIYNGTRILNYETVAENTEYILNLADKIQYEWGISFEMIDIGGGIGIPYFDNEDTFDLNSFRQRIISIVKQYKNNHPRVRFILESGRFLVGYSGFMVAKIIDIKHSKGEDFIIANGGTNCHMAAVGIGSIIKRNFPISLIQTTSKRSITLQRYNITGPLCTPNDLIGKRVEISKANIGDLIVIHSSGAYGLTASPAMFLSHGFPAEVLIKNNKPRLIRKRSSSKDIFRNQLVAENIVEE